MDSSRRLFIRQFSATAGCFVFSAVSPISGVLAAVQSGASPKYSFPQGVASADPQPDAVLLWTRIVDADGQEAVPVSVEVSSAENFNEIIVQADLEATADTDFTVRAFVDGLSANQWFYYRFVTPDGYASRTGRTRTAPPNEADGPLNIAVFSCQHYEEGFFNAYRQMMLDDQAANDDERIDLCMHMGDFIYENVNAGPGSFDEGAGGDSRFLQNADGTPRTAGDLPSGGRPRGRGEQLLPETLDDYRHIYKSYLHDTAIQDVRAWYPFVYIWDDHEVLNDYWQAYHPGGSIQKLKVAGNQAWFEYLPAILTESVATPAGRVEAKDFEFVEVTDSEPGTFDEDHLSEEPNTLAAIGSMTIYRSLQWGKMADLLLLDGRSYRGPRGLDNTILGGELIAYPPAPVDERLVRIMNEGRTANGGEPPDTLVYEGKEIPNPRVDTPRSSMLGARQKQWLKDSLIRSTARWQFLGNNVPMMRFGWDTTFRDHGTRSSIFWTDSWDGYPVERQELMEYISAQGLTNVISLTGDRHAHFAGMVYADYESENSKPVIPELVGAGISAQDRFRIQQILFGKDPELSNRTSFDGAKMGKAGERLPAMNAWLIHGAESARVLSDTADIAGARAVADPDINPHLVYSDIDAYGYYTVQVRAEQLTCEFVTTAKPVTDQTAGEPEVLRRIRMQIPEWTASVGPVISELSVEGQEPLMGIRES